MPPRRESLYLHVPQRSSSQHPAKHLGFVPWRAHPYVAFLIHRQYHGHCFRMDRLDSRVRRRRQEAIDQVMGPVIGFDFVPRSRLNSVQMWPTALQSRGLQVEHGAYECAGPRDRVPTTPSARSSVLMLANSTGTKS
jgi:hypothetical protein